MFKGIGNALNVQFDKDLNPYLGDNGDIYLFRDVSSLSSESIETVIDNFFSFKFGNVIDVPLYKFLVLKDNQKLSVLAIAHSLIFGYTSINKFYQLFHNAHAIYFNDSPDGSPSSFNDALDISLENKIISHYKSINDYLNSPLFGIDSIYWKNQLLDIGIMSSSTMSNQTIIKT